jgi:hypothetical protein
MGSLDPRFAFGKFEVHVKSWLLSEIPGAFPFGFKQENHLFVKQNRVRYLAMLHE